MKISEVKQLLGEHNKLYRGLGVSRQAVDQYIERWGDEMPERWQDKARLTVEKEYLALRSKALELSDWLEARIK